MDYYGMPEDTTYTFAEPGELENKNNDRHFIETATTTRLFITSKDIKELKDEDFHHDDDTLVKLKIKECSLVLFYAETPEAKQLAILMANVARNAPGPMYASVNLQNEKKTAQAFTKLNTEMNHPYYWARLRKTPFIMVYRDGWPQAFYNGNISTQALINYSLNKACVYSYNEKDQRVDNYVEEPQKNFKPFKTNKESNPYLVQGRTVSDYIEED